MYLLRCKILQRWRCNSGSSDGLLGMKFTTTTLRCGKLECASI
jgi:hypothetical protein